MSEQVRVVLVQAGEGLVTFLKFAGEGVQSVEVGVGDDHVILKEVTLHK